MIFHVGIDESGTNRGSKDSGVYVAAAVLFQDEDEYKKAEKYVDGCSVNRKVKEIKYSQSTAVFRRKFFKDIKKFKHETFFFVHTIYEDNSLDLYVRSLIDLTEQIIKMGKGRFNVKIDVIYSKKIQAQIIKTLSTLYKNNDSLVYIRFVKSETSHIVQIADMYAGDKRHTKTKTP